jgi:Flp pilus assembly protein TadD
MLRIRVNRAAVTVAALAFVSVTASSGCAARGKNFTSRFVKPGEPTVSFDEAPVTGAKQEGLGDWARKLRALQSKATTKSSMLPTIESTDPSLKAALMRLAFDESPESHRLVAAAYRKAGVDDYAFRHLQRALKLDPCDSAAYEGLARVWRDWGMSNVALSDAHKALHCRPQSASAYNTLGTVLEALGQHAEARRAFEFAVRLDSRAAYAFNNLCYLSVQLGEGAAAQQACERALALDPTITTASNNLAMAYAIQGETAKAEARLRDRRNTAQGIYNVGLLRMSLGQYLDAADAFDLALATKPSLADAAKRAAQARRAAALEHQED